MESLNFKFQKSVSPGEPVAEISATEAEKILLAQLDDPTIDRTQALWDLARFYSNASRVDEAMEYLRQVLAKLDNPESKAACILAMGATMEQSNDFDAAIRFYSEALALEPTNTRTWYLIHNNIGFCLNIRGRFEEGEIYCRKAIEIDPCRANAFKNLGIAHQGQGRFADAARAFVTATRVDAGDPRSLKLLEDLLEEHPELTYDFSGELDCCRAAVEFAAQAEAAAQPVPVTGFRRMLLLLSLRLRHFIRRVTCRRAK